MIARVVYFDFSENNSLTLILILGDLVIGNGLWKSRARKGQMRRRRHVDYSDSNVAKAQQSSNREAGIPTLPMPILNTSNRREGIRSSSRSSSSVAYKLKGSVTNAVRLKTNSEAEVRCSGVDIDYVPANDSTCADFTRD